MLNNHNIAEAKPAAHIYWWKHIGLIYVARVIPIIGNACHSLTHWLTHSLTDCRLVSLIDVTLACEDASSKLVEVVTLGDVVDEDRVGNSLWQILKMRFNSP